MAFRGHYQRFLKYRNSAGSTRTPQNTSSVHFHNHRQDEERSALIDHDDELHIEIGNIVTPQWTYTVNSITTDLQDISTKLKDLATLHSKHVNRPSLDDTPEEILISQASVELTELFSSCQRNLGSLGALQRYSSTTENRILKNISSSLARTLQERSSTFKKQQSNYLKRLRSREEYGSLLLDDLRPSSEDNFNGEDNTLEETKVGSVQFQMVEQNKAEIIRREKEVNSILQSIQDLNQIFRDLSAIVVDQGSILDRIDYNLETAAVNIQEGVQHLIKAQKLQKSSKKMLIIILLAVILVVLLVAFTISKTSS